MDEPRAPHLLSPANVNEDFDTAFRWMADWFVAEAWRHEKPQPLIAEACARLVAAGVPLDVFNVWILTLHPDYFGVSHSWDPRTGKVQTAGGSHDQWDQPYVRESPLKPVLTGSAAVRRRLDDPAWPRDFPVLADYAEAGMTDYCAMLLPSLGQEPHAISFATRRPGGFTLAELSLIDRLLPYMARLTDIQALSYMATTLLDTYVGRKSGARILNGSIRRGAGSTINAVIWLSDLRNFTELSSTLPRDEIIDLLNAYFDCLGDAVEEAGGEILKFIGDSMLAIQPLAEPADAPEQCRKALTAALAARERLAALNRQRIADASRAFDFGMALHVGDVLYGNIGTRNRLDFTVIGPAVNEAARIEALCPKLDAPILLSGRFADALPGELVSLGLHNLKGVTEPQEIFRPG